MTLFDLTFPTPAENLACDEALLDLCEESGAGEVLRFWEPRQHFVVVGYANQVATEVNVDACRAQGVPILRRCSGGGTVLQGPGCLNYSLILPITDDGPTRSVTSTNRFIMPRHAGALARILGREVSVRGITDLALDELKFSGNAQRRQRRAVLFHGTFLFDFDLARIGQLLLPPTRAPDYRQSRPHLTFVTNLPLGREVIRRTLHAAWAAEDGLFQIPTAQIARLVREKYSRAEWNEKF